MKILQSFFVTVVILASIYFMAINLEGLKEHEYLAVWAIGIAGLFFAAYAFLSKSGHDLRVT